MMGEAQRRRAVRHASIPWDGGVEDPRAARGQRHPHRGMLALIAAAFACGRVVLRRMEDLSEDLGRAARRALGLPRKVSDSALYRLLCEQRPAGLRETVVAMVKDWLEKKTIENDLFPKGVMTFDGKSTWTSTEHPVEAAKKSTCGASGKSVWSLSSLRAVLTSSSARPCVDVELIPAKKGEAPAFRNVFPRVCREFGEQFLIVTGDAGLACRENARLVAEHQKYYLWGLKGNQPQLHEMAVLWFTEFPGKLRARTEEVARGCHLVRELHTVTVAGVPNVDFDHIQQFWRVTQETYREGKKVAEEVRYFLSSIPGRLLTPTQQLGLIRLHWGIENGHNWTMDTLLEEDNRQPCQVSKDAIEVVCWLRVLGYNILARWRARAPKKDGLPLPWLRAMERLRDAWVSARPTEVSVATLG